MNIIPSKTELDARIATRANRRYLKAVRLAKTGDKVAILKEVKTYGPLGVLTDREQDALAILVDCLG